MPLTPIFMELTADGGRAVGGESEVDGYEGMIELDDWGWGVGFQAAEKDGRDDVVPSRFSFSKPPDRSSTVMMNALVSGKPFPKAVVHFVDWTHTEFELRLEIEAMRIVSYSLSGSSADASSSLGENWECDFNSVKLMHFFQTASKQRISKDVRIQRPPHASSLKSLPGDPEADKEKLKKERDALEEENRALREQLKGRR